MTYESMAYSDITIHDKNRIKRYIQRKRLADALSVLKTLDSGFSGNILDFGGGDGELCKKISEKVPLANVFCYEPADLLAGEALRNLEDTKNVRLVSSLDHLSGITFEYLFCLEVFEHLPPEQTIEALRAIDALLEKKGVGIIGVPNEIFIPALWKGLFRMFRRYGDFDANPQNILRAAFGRPPQVRPIAALSQGLPYHFQHLGFDYRNFKKLLMDFFKVIQIYGSPFEFLGISLNSEVYFILQKR